MYNLRSEEGNSPPKMYCIKHFNLEQLSQLNMAETNYTCLRCQQIQNQI